MENDVIELSKYVGYDKARGFFHLINNGSHILYREKNVICSYSGANEWCHNFICEMLDLYSGVSIYNYSLGTYQHVNEIKKIFETNPDKLIEWFNKESKSEWFSKMLESFDYIIDNLVEWKD